MLLDAFLAAVWADSGALLAGGDVNRLTLMAACNRDGRPLVDARSPGRSALRAGLSATGAVVEPGSTSGDDGTPADLLLVPIRDMKQPLGLLWAHVSAGVRIDNDVHRWRAEAYARIAALCMLGDDRLASVIGTNGIDELTGCLSYAGGCARLDTEIERANRGGAPLCCSFLDLDGFKRVNDRDGHVAGNEVLAGVGAAFLADLRVYDTVARFGGDEFVLILPDTELADARSIANRLVGRAMAQTSNHVSTAFNISCGTAQLDGESDTAGLLEAADRELRLAKAAR